MSDVNKQLLYALRIARKKLDDEGYFPTEEIDLAIAAAEQAQQAETSHARAVLDPVRAEYIKSFIRLEHQAGESLPAKQQAEPVAAQCRFEGEEEWSPCTLAHHLLVQAHPKEWPHYETRALYARSPAVAVPQEAADSIRSPFNACCNKEHCRAMLAAQKGGA